jgi:hypothetical protein
MFRKYFGIVYVNLQNPRDNCKTPLFLQYDLTLSCKFHSIFFQQYQGHSIQTYFYPLRHPKESKVLGIPMPIMGV